jgi:hypothetical protein
VHAQLPSSTLAPQLHLRCSLPYPSLPCILAPPTCCPQLSCRSWALSPTAPVAAQMRVDFVTTPLACSARLRLSLSRARCVDTAVLQKLGIVTNSTRLAGASGGSAVSAMSCAGVPGRTQYQAALPLAQRCRWAPSVHMCTQIQGCTNPHRSVENSLRSFLLPPSPGNSLHFQPCPTYTLAQA